MPTLSRRWTSWRALLNGAFPRFLLLGLIIPSSLQVKHHALVLIYKERITYQKKISIFHVFLAWNNVSVRPFTPKRTKSQFRAGARASSKLVPALSQS